MIIHEEERSNFIKFIWLVISLCMKKTSYKKSSATANHYLFSLCSGIEISFFLFYSSFYNSWGLFTSVVSLLERKVSWICVTYCIKLFVSIVGKKLKNSCLWRTSYMKSSLSIPIYVIIIPDDEHYLLA